MDTEGEENIESEYGDYGEEELDQDENEDEGDELGEIDLSAVEEMDVGDYISSTLNPPKSKKINKLKTAYGAEKQYSKITTGAPPGPSTTGPRVARLQKSYIVRKVPSFIPTEIYGASRPFKLPDKLPSDTPAGTAKFMNMLRDFGGFNPASLNTPIIDDRILRSSKAEDESETEHYQRLMASLRTLDQIRMNRVSVVEKLVGLSQKELKENQENIRYSKIIEGRHIKAVQDVKNDRIKNKTVQFDLESRKKDELAFGNLNRKVKAKIEELELANLKSFPMSPLAHIAGGGSDPAKDYKNQNKRLNYVRPKILYGYYK